VIEHTEGWRGSLAYPTRLYVLFTGREEHASRVAVSLERYGVPVDTLRAWNRQDAVEALAA
jgi:hypothetical protein